MIIISDQDMIIYGQDMTLAGAEALSPAQPNILPLTLHRSPYYHCVDNKTEGFQVNLHGEADPLPLLLDD